MPIHLPITTTRISRREFGELSYAVMQQVFAIHHEYGRFFDEKIYKRELSKRMKGVLLETSVEVTFQSFLKRYYLDVLVHGSGLFEFKAVEAFVPRHRSQTINYLLLADLAHGLLVNTRPETIGREFVNCKWRLKDLRDPVITEHDWQSGIPQALRFQEVLVTLVRDWGTCLDLALYEEAMTHFMGGESVFQDVPVDNLGTQRTRLIAPDVSFKITALSENTEAFVLHARRSLSHTPLRAILWANMTPQGLSFSTIQNDDKKLGTKNSP